MQRNNVLILGIYPQILCFTRRVLYQMTNCAMKLLVSSSSYIYIYMCVCLHNDTLDALHYWQCRIAESTSFVTQQWITLSSFLLGIYRPCYSSNTCSPAGIL